jgi:hypothetical protein
MSRFAHHSISTSLALAFFFALAAAAVGCGGATGDSPEERSTGGSGVETRQVPVNGSLTDECGGEKGLTGNSVLDKLDVPTRAVFRRFPADKPYGYTDPATSSRATIRVRYEGGDVRCTPGGDTSGAQMNPAIVPARVTVVVRVDFTTEDGLFDEHVSGELSSSDAASKSVTLDASIPIADLRGKYKAIAEADPLGPSVPMKLSGTFTKADLTDSEGAMDHGERFVGLFRFDW